MAMVLNNATLIDGTGADPRERCAIAIEGERISSVGKTSGVHDGQALDLTDLFILPGLIDAHAHLGLAAGVAEFAGEHAPGLTPAAEIAARIFRNCELCLDAGFTTVRDMAGLDDGVARAVRHGLVRGPRIYPSGAALVQLGGHGHMSGPFAEQDHVCALPGLVQMISICNGPDEVRVAARRNFRRGATQLKAFISGGVVSSTDRLEDTQLTIEELRAAVVEAQARDSYVAGHAHNSRAIQNGLAAGLTCFEHGTYLDEATAKAMAKAGAALDPTFTVCRLMATDAAKWGLPDHVVPRIRGCEAAMAESTKLAWASGVLVGSGSDLLGGEQNRRGLELTIKAELLGTMNAIVSATRNNAKIMGLADQLGTVEAGKLADLIAVRGDPLAEPALFDDPSRVVLVIKSGKIEKNTI